jgi:hypothetical protein
MVLPDVETANPARVAGPRASADASEVELRASTGSAGYDLHCRIAPRSGLAVRRGLGEVKELLFNSTGIGSAPDAAPDVAPDAAPDAAPDGAPDGAPAAALHHVRPSQYVLLVLSDVNASCQLMVYYIDAREVAGSPDLAAALDAVNGLQTSAAAVAPLTTLLESAPWALCQRSATPGIPDGCVVTKVVLVQLLGSTLDNMFTPAEIAQLTTDLAPVMDRLAAIRAPSSLHRPDHQSTKQ